MAIPSVKQRRYQLVSELKNLLLIRIAWNFLAPQSRYMLSVGFVPATMSVGFVPATMR